MPTNTPLPTVSTGGTIAAATTNDAAVLNAAIGLFGAGTAITGTKPPVTAPNFQVQAGLQGITLNGSSQGTVVWPATFPNGILFAVIVPVNTGNSAAQAVPNTLANTTAGGCGITVYSQTGTGLGAGGVDVYFLAIGF